LLPLIFVLIINAVPAVASPWTGWFFSVDAANHYSRGPWFYLHVAIIFGLLLATAAMLLIYRRRIDPRYLRALLLFIVPPVTGAILQVLFYGLSLNWPSMMISVVIIYLQIQDRGLHTDHLTGIANRRHFEKIINSRIRRNQLERFAVIIADLDGFKRINDQFGHDVGDEALLTAVRLLRNSLRRDDLIARFGGDEFYILLDISDETILQTLVNRIDREFERYNERSGLPYQMGVSMGSAIYEPESGLDATQFLRQVDQLMYHEKNRRQSKLRGG
jgi:diguanylate cyclase (GGDEF)-like protein